MKTPKTLLNQLEKLFAAEIENRLPFQTRAKWIEKMAADGYVEPLTMDLGRDRFGPIMVSGWQLTHAGRLLYCMSCDEQSGMNSRDGGE